MAFTSGHGGRAPLSEINVTPLVDVMLVLLIIFMVAAPMMTTGVTVDLPNADAPTMDVDEDQPLISIGYDSESENPTLYLFSEEVKLEDLAKELQEDPRVQKQQEVFLHADERVPYGVVVRVLTVVKNAGIAKMGLVTDPLVEE